MKCVDIWCTGHCGSEEVSHVRGTRTWDRTARIPVVMAGAKMWREQKFLPHLSFNTLVSFPGVVPLHLKAHRRFGVSAANINAQAVPLYLFYRLPIKSAPRLLIQLPRAVHMCLFVSTAFTA